jgi:hypothetical protein
MEPLSLIVAKTDLLTTTNISIVGIRQITTQQRERETMAAELVTGAPQFLFISYNAQRPQQLRSSVAG